AADRAQPHRQADRAEMRAHPCRVARRAEAEPGREIERHRHARAHRLAVQQVRSEVGLGLQRMGESVAKIEERPQVGRLALVGPRMKSMPRSSTEAAKPARSPTTPPPSATSVVLRSGRWSSKAFTSWPNMSNSLLRSPAGTNRIEASIPAFLKELKSRAP